MNVVELRDPFTGSLARIAVDQGFNCFAFEAQLPDGRTVSVLDADAEFASGQGGRPSHSGIPLLFPYPNRIRRGRFRWDGQDYVLPQGEVAYEGNGNAIHGFCLDRPWRVTAQTEDSVTGEFQLSVNAPERREFWPADFCLSVSYRVAGPSLVSEIIATNPDSRPLPFGFGTHAYFRLPLDPNSDPGQCRVFAPVSRRWILDDYLPTGEMEPVPPETIARGVPYAGLKLDDVFSGIEFAGDEAECRVVDPAAGLQIVQRFPPDFRELVAFTPPWTTAVCLEPYTCVTDAVNLQQRSVDAGLRVLQPGETWRTRIVIAVEPAA